MFENALDISQIFTRISMFENALGILARMSVFESALDILYWQASLGVWERMTPTRGLPAAALDSAIQSISPKNATTICLKVVAAMRTRARAVAI